MSSLDEETPPLQAWFEWNQKCTIEKCSPESARVLSSFARSRFRSQAAKKCGPEKKMPSGIQDYFSSDTQGRQLAWLELELHLWKTRDDNGKRKVYKNWLFERAEGEDDPLAFLQKYCSSMFRTIVKDRCEAEGCSIKLAKKGVTLEPLYGRKGGEDGGGDFDLVDILLLEVHGNRNVESEQSMQVMVEETAQEVFAAAHHREKVALAAKFLEIPIYDPRVLLAAGCGKSVLSAASKSFEERLVAMVRKDCEGSRSQDMFEFFKRLYRRLVFLADEWKNSEMGDDSPF